VKERTVDKLSIDDQDFIDEQAVEENLSALAEHALVKRIEAAHQRAEHAAHSMFEYAVETGELLLEAKRRCDHGGWLPWLEQHVTFSARTAQAYTRIATHQDELAANTQSTAHLSIDAALHMLATPTPEYSPAIDAAIEQASAAFIESEDAGWEVARLTYEGTWTEDDPATDGDDRISLAEWCAHLQANGQKLSRRDAERYRAIWARFGADRAPDTDLPSWEDAWLWAHHVRVPGLEPRPFHIPSTIEEAGEVLNEIGREQERYALQREILERQIRLRELEQEETVAHDHD
jgi:hypothetical protein